MAILLFTGLAALALLLEPPLATSGLLAYSFGLRHGVDADHIAAIDNVTRRLAAGGRKPATVGLYFALGHSSVVTIMCAVVAVAADLVEKHMQSLSWLGGIVGASISGSFLLFIGAVNLWNARQLRLEWREQATYGGHTHAIMGFCTRCCPGLFDGIQHPWQMLPVGFLFGLGFDTSSEVGLLGIVSVSRGDVPRISIMLLPMLFAGGMCLVDTLNGVLMAWVYGRALDDTMQRLYYSLFLTVTSGLLALVVGCVELLGVVAAGRGLKGGVWDAVAWVNDHFEVLGCTVVGVFILSMLVAFLCHKRVFPQGGAAAQAAQRPCSRSLGRFLAGASRPCSATTVTLPADSNQALGIAQYAKDFIGGKYGDKVDASVWERIEMFHTDSVMCGVSALALRTNAPTVLREEAISYPDPNGATVFGSGAKCAPEKAICANASAVREWDSNGTVFGYNPNIPGHTAGEFGHNDFYPVVMAAAQVTGDIDGKKALLAMICLDEIRGRLAEVFSLKSYKIDHVVHGAIASAAVYGALLGASAEQIESAIGMAVAHYIPFRAIRAGKQLSDSKGASAAISTEAAVLSMRRAMRGFVGPKDILRNPEAIFRFFEPTTGTTASKDNVDITLGNKVRWGVGPSPFNLVLSTAGSDFAVCGMHFKLGLYEHQSAGALEGLISALVHNPDLAKGGADAIEGINIVAYEPAFGIIGDPAKKDPTTRQSADHSMAFIVSRILVKAQQAGKVPSAMDDAWMELMLSPYDYGKDALYDPATRAMMQKISFSHGGPEFDAKYPDGIPTQIDITLKGGKVISSGEIMYPSGHARNTTADLRQILAHKNRMLGDIVFSDRAQVDSFVKRLVNMKSASAAEVQDLYNFDWSSMRSLDCIDG